MTRFDDAVGRYLHLEVGGVLYRVYFEETGSGIPLLLQHTAGADGRQWRHLLENRELQRRFRMIAYDLPYHGRSLPPENVSWWEEEYRLTKQFALAFVLAFAGALELEQPAFMGASVGGHLALDLAIEHPGFFRAVVALEGGVYTPEKSTGMFNDPRISSANKASLMYALTSPASPERYRRETAWIYSQGAPPVFKGDLNYYGVEHDLRDLPKGGTVDTVGTSVYIRTGDYDWSSPPEQGEQAAGMIPGASFETLPGLGHFPMSEHPNRFFELIRPVLTAIAASGGGRPSKS